MIPSKVTRKPVERTKDVTLLGELRSLI